MGNCVSTGFNSMLEFKTPRSFSNVINLIEFEKKQYAKRKLERSKLKHIDVIIGSIT